MGFSYSTPFNLNDIISFLADADFKASVTMVTRQAFWKSLNPFYNPQQATHFSSKNNDLTPEQTEITSCLY